MSVKFDGEYLRNSLQQDDYDHLMPLLLDAHNKLHEKTGKGHDYTGWMDLPKKIDDAFLNELVKLGEDVRENSDCLVSIGIGGSYIGIRATLEFLIGDQKLPVYYAGNNISSGAMHYLLEKLRDKRVTVCVISKSGTTTEPALAFRIIKKFMEDKYSGEDLKNRIICVTDEKKGALRTIADKEGFKSFTIPDDVGGRFSIFTPVGLVPLAIAGIDIHGLVNGARAAQDDYAKPDLKNNAAYLYGASRYLLYRKGKAIEILSTFYQRLSFVEEWWKQLFGESEGKDGKGIFPASLNFTADLHSMGQLIQEGDRNMFETFLIVKDSGHGVMIPEDPQNLDNFNCVANKDLDWVNKQAYKATANAHFEGGIPNMTIIVEKFDAESLGHLFYFFQKAVAIMGYLLNVNPFNQPGVEAYKKKMFKLLGR